MDTNCDMLRFIQPLVHTLDLPDFRYNAQKYSNLPTH